MVTKDAGAPGFGLITYSGGAGTLASDVGFLDSTSLT